MRGRGEGAEQEFRSAMSSGGGDDPKDNGAHAEWDT